MNVLTITWIIQGIIQFILSLPDSLDNAGNPFCLPLHASSYLLAFMESLVANTPSSFPLRLEAWSRPYIYIYNFFPKILSICWQYVKLFIYLLQCSRSETDAPWIVQELICKNCLPQVQVVVLWNQCFPWWGTDHCPAGS